MSRTDLTDADLANLVARTFRAQAARVRAPADPFDPTARAGTDDVPVPRGRRRRWRRVGVAAAAVVLVLAAGAVVTQAGDDGRGRTRTQSSTATTPMPEASADATPSTDAAPDGASAPGWVPEDLTLWSVRWSTAPGAVGGLDNLQLFTRAAGGGVLVDIQPANPGSSSGGDPLTVRGLPATVTPAKEFPESSSTVFWQEDASLSATFTGMTVDEAVAVLDSLSWRSDDHQDGFAPPGDGSVELAAETEPDPGGAAPVSTVEFVYADDALTVMPGESRQLTVRATSAVGGVSRQTLLALLNGEGGPEADGAVRSYDPTYGTLQVVWPDGRQWWIDANASALTEDELAQVAAGMAPTSGEQLETMAAEAAARVEDLPVVAAATVGSGAEITVRGPDGAGLLLCLTPGDAGDEQCADPFDETALAGGPAGPLVAHIVVDGRWFVVAATTGEPVTIPQSGTGDTSRPPSELGWRPGIAGETADDGTWRFLLAEVPADVDFVGLETPGIGMGMQLTDRPEA